MTTFGERLREIREEENITQTALAEALGILPSTINHYENDRRTPTIQRLSDIADELAVSMDNFVFNVTYPVDTRMKRA